MRWATNLAIGGAALLAFAMGAAEAQTIYPLNRAEILAGAKFDFKVEFTSSPVVAMVSARRLEVSSMPSVICTERSSISCTMLSDFSWNV